MNIYLYDKNTKEYLGSRIADSDPAETKLQGKFVPLVPDYATLVEPPQCNQNETPVFNDEKWTIIKDYRKNFLKADENLNVSAIKTLGEQDGFCIVDKETGTDIMQNPNLYKYNLGNIVKKTDEEIRVEKITERNEKFEQEFFETSLGWIRRNVTMKDGSKKDFLSDLLPAIKTGVDLGQEVHIITYEKPDFSQEEISLDNIQERKIVTQDFIRECLLQIVEDFGM